MEKYKELIDSMLYTMRLCNVRSNCLQAKHEAQ
jgi:hypothetical protein